jgi:hypothetical protein
MSFKRLDSEDFILSADSITAALWSTNSPTLNTFHTDSLQEASTTGDYYLSVYQSAPSTAGSEVQFDIAYGNAAGSGSALYNNLVPGNSPTKTIYGQYKALILGDENANFIFGNVTASDFWALAVSRNRYKESLFPGSLTLALNGPTNRILLTDDSQYTTTNVFTDAGRVYNLISGSAGVKTRATDYVTSNGWSLNQGSYGWFLPDIGVILLNPLAIGSNSTSGGIGVSPNRTTTVSGTNNTILFNAINGTLKNFTLNSQETVTSDYVFIRARNSEFNYSENPTFISGSTGEVLYDDFVNNPQVYFTTVGMYNDNNELLAVAKLSRPLIKDFTKECLVRVKLDF